MHTIKLLVWWGFWCWVLLVAAKAQAQPYAAESLGIRLKQVRDTARVDVLSRLCRAYAQQDTTKAFFYGRWALRLADSLHDAKGKANALRRMASVYFYQGDYLHALNLNRQSVRASDSLHDKRAVAAALNNLGNIYAYLGRYEDAINYYKRSLLLEQQLHNARAELFPRVNISEALLHLGRLQEALAHYRTTLQMALKLKDPYNTVFAEWGLSSVYLQLAQYSAAADTALLALQGARHYKDRMNEAASLLVLAKVALARQEPLKARDSARHAVEVALRFGAKREAQQALLVQAKAEAALGLSAAAYQHMAQHEGLHDSLLRQQTTQRLLTLEQELVLAHKQLQIDSLSRMQVQYALVRAKEKGQRDALLVGLVLAGVLSLVSFWAYGQQKRSLHLLTVQTEEIRLKGDEIKAKNEQLSNAFLQIEEQHDQIRESIHYARRIQEAILPPATVLARSFPAHFIFYQPRDIVSGDFYFFAEKGGYHFLALVDCTGHGVAGAFMSLIGEALLTQIIIDKNIYSPDEILRELHLAVRKSLKQEEGQSRDGMDVALIALSSDGKELTYAGANNPLYYLRTDGVLHELKATKFPIGGWQRETERTFTMHRLSLEEPTMLYMVSDGYRDQFGGNIRGRKYGARRLAELLSSIYLLSMPAQQQAIKEAFDEWRGSQKQLDDVLVLGARLGPNMAAYLGAAN